jgi:branched-subunit amino acid transport protein
VSANIVYAILVTSLATFLSRFLGVLTSQGIKETSKLFKWFNCLAYATLAALIARTIIFPAGILIDASYSSRLIVVLLSLFIFFISKKNFVYPTIFSAICMAIINNYV